MFVMKRLVLCCQGKLIALLACVLVLSACSPNQAASSQATNRPTPTLSTLFSSLGRETPTPLEEPTSQPLPTRVGEPAATVRPTETFEQQIDQQFVRSFVYSDTLDANWTLSQSYAIQVDAKNQKNVDAGKYSITVTPKPGVTSLVFALKKGVKSPLRRERVAGVRFRLSGGKNVIPNDAMAVGMFGSNAQPYWIAGDDSVAVDHPITVETPRFSETRLYYLGFDYTIPADTWVDVVVWLNKLQFDPSYTYVTGFQLKVDQALLNQYSVDQVEILFWPDAS